jgi:hypothetical protein
MAVKWIGITDAFYMDGRWTEKADLWHCDECDGDLWSVPTVQKCLRKDFKCVMCEEKRKKKPNPVKDTSIIWWWFRSVRKLIKLIRISQKPRKENDHEK